MWIPFHEVCFTAKWSQTSGEKEEDKHYEDNVLHNTQCTFSETRGGAFVKSILLENTHI